MNKPTAIKRFVMTIIFVIIGFVLTFCQFNIPFTNYTYNGFINSIKLGLDLKGGVLAVYEATALDDSEISFDDALEATRTRIYNMITEDYSEAQVSIQQGNRIRVEVPDVSDPEEIFDSIGKPAKLEFKLENSADAEAILTGSNIEDVYASYNSQDGEWGVTVKFDAEGAKIFGEVTSAHIDESLYIFVNNELISSPNIKEAITGGTTFISGSENEKAAEQFATQIMSGTFSVELSLLENSVISATLGEDALKYSIIAGVIGLILIFAYMIWRYKMMGVIASSSLCVYVLLMMFFLQAIPGIQLTLAGVAGIILSIGMAIDGNIIVFERIKEEYASGKRIQSAIKSGFRKATPSILDSNITTIIAAIILWIFGTGSIQGFAITLLIGLVLSVFTSLVLTRGFMALYYPFNSTKAEHYSLSREVITDAK